MQIAPSSIDILDLEEALAELEALDPRDGRIVALHYFAGLTQEEIGRQVGLSGRSVRKHLEFALRWLRGRLDGT